MENKSRKITRISPIVLPIVDITRKISKLENIGDNWISDANGIVINSDEVRSIPAEFVSHMKEVFLEFDKDRDGYICTRELGPLLRAMGQNPTHADVSWSPQSILFLMLSVLLVHSKKY